MCHPSQKSRQSFDGWRDRTVFKNFTVWQFVLLAGPAGWHARQNDPKAHFSKINNKKHTIDTIATRQHAAITVEGTTVAPLGGAPQPQISMQCALRN
jgi:hypothetical protein